MVRDSLGDRMKQDYENRSRFLLPRRTYTMIRVDGKAFHTYTRDCERPFDQDLMADMDTTATALCREIEGVQVAFVQSDEISALVTDFENEQTEAWFDGSVQKLASISASIATAHFNRARQRRQKSADLAPAYFDSRAFTIPDSVEVENYFIWRQQDATRNSVSMTAQAHFPHERLQGKSSDELQELLWQEAGINWNDMPAEFKRGRCAIKSRTVENREYVDRRTGATQVAIGVERCAWEVVVPPVFTRERDWLTSHIPKRM